MKENNLAKNTILLSIGAIFNKGLAFIMIPLFSSWLTTEDYGTFDLLCTYITMLIPIFSLSIGEGVFRLGIESDEDTKKEYILGGLAIYVIGSLILGIIVAGIFIFSRNFIIIYFFFMFLGEYFNKYLQSFLRTIKKLTIYSFSTAISTIFIFSSVFLFVKIFNFELSGIILGYGCGYLFGNIIIIIWSKYYRFVSSQICFQRIIDMIKYSLPLIPNSISWWIVDASDRSIINMILGSNFNGIYAIAYRIPNLCTSIFSMFNIAWQEAAIDMSNSDERNKYYNLIYNKMILILISICAGILSCNFILFDIIFDIKYSNAHLYTPILVTSVIFCSISQFLGGIQISLKKPKENGITTVAGALINIIIHLALIKFMGLYAAAISTMLSNLTIAIFRKMTLRRDVVLKFNMCNFKYIFIYIYLAISAYLYQYLSISINIVNLCIASIMFIYINREFILKILKRM